MPRTADTPAVANTRLLFIVRASFPASMACYSDAASSLASPVRLPTVPERTLEIAACRRIGSFPTFARAHSRFCENAASSQRPTQATQYRQDDYLLPNEWAQTPGCIRLAVPQVRTSCRSIQNQVAHYPLYRIRKGASFLHARVYQARSWRSPCNRVRRR
jgi:hypothetical protein